MSERIIGYPKQKTIIDKKYLDWIKEQPCYDCIGGFGDVTHSHQTLKIPERGKGMALKDHDPLSLPKHTSEHQCEHMALYKIKNRAEGIVRHILRYKTECQDIIFLDKVHEYIKSHSGKEYRWEDTAGFIISIWEDHR